MSNLTTSYLKNNNFPWNDLDFRFRCASNLFDVTEKTCISSLSNPLLSNCPNLNADDMYHIGD